MLLRASIPSSVIAEGNVVEGLALHGDRCTSKVDVRDEYLGHGDHDGSVVAERGMANSPQFRRHVRPHWR
jgi:hypothetical protein